MIKTFLNWFKKKFSKPEVTYVVYLQADDGTFIKMPGVANRNAIFVNLCNSQLSEAFSRGFNGPSFEELFVKYLKGERTLIKHIREIQ
jgi:hypothetical protein